MLDDKPGNDREGYFYDDEPLIVGDATFSAKNNETPLWDSPFRDLLLKIRASWEKGHRIVSIIISLASLAGGLIAFILLFRSFFLLGNSIEDAMPDGSTVLSHQEYLEAQERYSTIQQQGDIAACDEFKGKSYQGITESGTTTTTELYYSCVYNLSLWLKDYDLCLSLTNDTSKRICLHGLATAYLNPQYCLEADQYAQEDVAREPYSLASTDQCFWNIKACDYISDPNNREGCLLYRAREENILNRELCQSFQDPQRKEECICMVAVFENDPDICQDSEDVDYCIYRAVQITAPNMQRESFIDKSVWCERIKGNSLRRGCLE